MQGFVSNNQVLDVLDRSGLSLEEQIVASETAGRLLRAAPYGYSRVNCSEESSEVASPCQNKHDNVQ